MIMKTKIFALMCGLLILPACFFSNQQHAAKRTLFIQAPLDLGVIKDMQEAMTPVINTILQEELGVHDYKDHALFFFKKRQAITIAYVNDMNDDGEDVVFTALDSLPGAPIPHKVTLTANLDFFGDPTTSFIDLVMLIDDPDKELAVLNSTAREALSHANENYKRVHNANLYDRNKSERFPYLPHLSLGHLRPNLIKEFIIDTSLTDKVEETVERIKQRIIQAVSQALSNMLTTENKKVLFYTLSVYDLEKRTYIKEYPLGV